MPEPTPAEATLMDKDFFESMDSDKKLDTIFEALRLLNDQVHKLNAFMTAPAKKPSAVDKLTETIGQLVVETGAQTKMLAGIGNTLEQIIGPETGSSGGPVVPSQI